MRIGQLSAKTGVSRDAIRLYERRGLIASDRHLNGYRDFAEGSVAIINMIKLAQSVGFRLSELEPEMRQISRDGLGSEKVAEMLVGKLGEIDARLQNLTDNRQKLITMLEQVCPIHAAR